VPDVIRFIGVGDVFAIPGSQNITFPEGCDGQMAGIAIGVGRHDFVGNVVLNELVDLWCRLKKVDVIQQAQALALFG
jgi:hypothetical protein